MAAAFVRLCVETTSPILLAPHIRAAAFVRLCVETAMCSFSFTNYMCSRLRAAVC